MSEENKTISPSTIDSPVERHYAGFWIRAVASVIDDLIVMLISLGLTLSALYAIYFATNPAPTFGAAFTGWFINTVNFAAMLAVSLPYYIGFHWRYGWTPGKRLFRIRVIRESDGGNLSFGRSSGRYFAQILSTLPFGAGYLMAALNKKKQALHDALAGTVSIFEQ